MALKLISANIRFENPKDGDHIWQNRKPVLSKILNSYQADIIGTQEGREPQLRDLAASLEQMELVDQKRTWIKIRMYPSIFYNPKTVEIIDSGDIWLSHEPEMAGSSSFDSAFPRLCTWVKAKKIDSGKHFLYVNVHLDHIKTETRQGQIEVLIDEVGKICGTLPLILSGDFNEGPSEDVRALLMNSSLSLIDPWLEKKLPEKGSHHHFNGESAGNKRIDWVLTEKAIKCHNIFFDEQHLEGIYPSDHFPLIGEFDF